jgi:hypothetical protein
MSVGEDEFDALAYALVNASFDFDAVERGHLRATWSEDNVDVTVTDVESGDTVTYSADDLVLATSDREVENAREPNSI